MRRRELARSFDGRVIHRKNCTYARVPWTGADALTDNLLLDVKLRFGYRVCKVCKPPLRVES